MPSTLEEAIALLQVLWAEVVQLRAENARLTARVQELEARLGQNSSNSSRPPSADPPHGRTSRREPPAGRRPGGQPSHPAHERPLRPSDQVDRVVEQWPETCAHCQGSLSADPALMVGEPARHQVTELPPIRAEVTEYRLHRVRCPTCGGETRACLPPEAPGGAFGPRLQATVAVFSGRCRLSRREVADVCGEMLGADVAVGSVDRLCQETGQALAEPVAELAQAVREAPVANMDETGWKQAGQRGWLWVVVTTVVTVFTIAKSRGSQVVKELLGETYAGSLGSDRWSAYSYLPVERRQVCWAHLRRDFQALVDYGGAAVFRDHYLTV